MAVEDRISIYELSKRVQILENKLLETQRIIDIQTKHIAYLQRKTRGFFDRFKFGAFKSLDINVELGSMPTKPSFTFRLNDD